MIETKFEKILLVNTVTQQNLVLSEQNTDYILDGRPDWGSVSANIGVIGHGNKITSMVTDIRLGTRDITVTGWVVAEDFTAIKKKKAFLNKFVNPFQELELAYEDYAIYFTPNKSIKWAKDYSQNNEIMCKFEIEGLASNPLFHQYKPSIIRQSPSLSTKVFSMVIKEDHGTILGVAGQGSSRKITNEGDVPMGFQLTLVNTGSPLNNLTLDNDGSFIKLRGRIDRDETLILCTRFGEEKIILINKSGDKTDIISRLARGSSLFTLKPGDNTITISSDEGNLENLQFELEYSPLFLEVQ